MGSKRGKKERRKLGQIFFILNLQTAIPDAALHALYEKRAPPMKEIPAFLSQKCEEGKKSGTAAACWGGWRTWKRS